MDSRLRARRRGHRRTRSRARPNGRDHLRLNSDGQVQEMTVIVRPLPAATAALRVLGAGLGRRRSPARRAIVSALARPLGLMTRLGDRLGVLRTRHKRFQGIRTLRVAHPYRDSRQRAAISNSGHHDSRRVRSIPIRHLPRKRHRQPNFVALDGTQREEMERAGRPANLERKPWIDYWTFSWSRLGARHDHEHPTRFGRVESPLLHKLRDGLDLAPTRASPTGRTQAALPDDLTAQAVRQATYCRREALADAPKRLLTSGPGRIRAGTSGESRLGRRGELLVIGTHALPSLLR